MAISHREHLDLTCPACGAEFQADVWALVDAAERPDLEQALRDETLNVVTCPRCGRQGPAGAPLLYHDPARSRVYFAAPSEIPEHVWREQAQGLLQVLIGSLPIETRLPYLADVRIEQEVAGVRHAVLRLVDEAEESPPRVEKTMPTDERAAELAASIPGLSVGTGGLTRSPRPRPAPAQRAAKPEGSPLLDAVQLLLGADTEAEFQAVIDAHPVLLTPEADAAFADLIAFALDEGQREVAEALRAAYATLHRRHEPAQADEVVDSQQPEPTPLGEPRLSDPAYQALMRAGSSETLLEVVRDHPSLLEAAADVLLTERANAALDEGHERLAAAIEQRREELTALRERLLAPEALLEAVRALLEAEDDDALAQALITHPALLTDAAQEALNGLAAGARAEGDDALANFADERGAMMRRVREELERA